MAVKVRAEVVNGASVMWKGRGERECVNVIWEKHNCLDLYSYF